MFVSIRWKAIFLLSVIMLLVTLAWVGRSVYHDLLTYREAIREDQDRYQNTLDQLINDNFLKLSQYGQLIGDYGFIKSANRYAEPNILQEQLSAKWFDLNLNIGVDYISVMNDEGESIVSAHQFVDQSALQRFHNALDLFSNNLQEDWVKKIVYCDSHCSQVVSEPFFFADGSKGHIVIGQNMTDLVSRYHAISEANIAVLIHQPKTRQTPFYIDNWQARLWAANDFQNTLDLLGTISSKQSNVNNIYFDDSLWNIWRSEYRVNKLLPRNYFQVGSPAIYVNIIDNGEQKVLVKQELINQVLAGLLAWLFAVTLIVMALLGPIQRILRVVQVMALLPKQQFDQVRKNFAVKKAATRDELTELENSTLLLTDNLEALQDQVESTNDQLREQILTVTRSKDFLQRLFDNANLFILTQDTFYRFTQSNAFFDHYFMTEQQKAFVDLLIDDADRNELIQKSVDLLAQKIASFQQEVWMKTKGNQLLMVAWTHTLVASENGVNQILSIGIDITQRKQDEHALQWLANNDSLTQIGNRRVFHATLEKMLAQKSEGAVVFIDVNRFKQINDIYGHLVGDQVLIEIADKLKSHVREKDLVCRLAGDEFTLILAGVNQKSLQKILIQLASHLSGTLVLDDERRVDYTASLGAALFPEHGEDPQTLIVHSDMAMYQAKKKGLNHWHIFDFGDDSLQEQKDEHRLMATLRKALQENLFELKLQPIMSIATKEISHYEVLLRLKDEDGNVISPGSFIPVAERVGLINELDTWVVTNIFEKIKECGPERTGSIKFSINISAPSLQDQYFANKIFMLSQQHDIEPDRFIIELTETAYIDNLDQVLKNLNYLHEQGFAIALDDFGVGFSSFSYMKKLPLSYIKLDGSYIKDLCENEKNRAFIESVVIMAKAFNMLTIAEYVQDVNTLNILEEIGVDYAQGYLIGRAEPQILSSEQVQFVQQSFEY